MNCMVMDEYHYYEYRPCWLLVVILFCFFWPWYIPWLIYDKLILFLRIIWIRMKILKYKQLLKDINRMKKCKEKES